MSWLVVGLIFLALLGLIQYIRKVIQRNKINALKSDLRKKSRLNIVITGMMDCVFRNMTMHILSCDGGSFDHPFYVS